MIIGALAYLVTTQIVKLASDLPAYQQTVGEKLSDLQLPGSDIFERVGSAVQGLGEQVGVGEQVEAQGERPMVVENAPQSPWAVAQGLLGSLLAPFATAAIVTVFVIFLLLEREDLRDRFLKLVSRGDLQTSTRVMNEAAKRVSRYLLIQFTVNLTYGVIFGAGLWFIGIPNAVLWGLLAALLRYIPFVGTLIAASIPFALAFAVDPGWSMLIYAVALFVTLEMVTTNAIEPKLHGSSTGLSPLAVIVAAIFWATLWGPIGLILATPLTVCLVVLGRNVPQLKFLDTVLGSEPALTPEEKLYQRLLAGNMEEAVELGERAVEKMPLSEFFDEVAVGTLRRAERDRSLAMSDVRIRRLVADGMVQVAQEAADRASTLASPDTHEGVEAESSVPRSVGTPVLAIGARSELDRAAAEMVGLALRGRGIDAKVLPPMVVGQSGLAQIDFRGISVVCLCYVEADPRSSIRYIARRLKQRSPETKVIACLLAAPASAETSALDDEDLGVDALATGIGHAAALIDGWVARHPSDPMQAPKLPANEAERLHALRRLGLTSSSGRYFDEVAQKVSAAFGAPIALVTVVEEEHQLWPGAAGLPAGLDACRLGERDTSICAHVVANDEVLVIEDVAVDARFANNPFLLEHGIRFYAGAPLRTLDGYTIGSLCVIDYKPRKFGAADREMLSTIANSLMSKIELNCYGFDM